MPSRLLAILAFVVAAPLVRAEPLDLTNAKNEEAATTLIARFFESIGLDVFDKEPETFGLRYGRFKLAIIPYFKPEDGCRINAHVSFPGRKENLKDAKAMHLVNEINDEYNFVAFSFDNDGDPCFRYTLVLDKKLEAKVVQRWLRHIENQTEGILEGKRAELEPFLAKKTGK
jgi:hypothetical protein